MTEAPTPSFVERFLGQLGYEKKRSTDTSAQASAVIGPPLAPHHASGEEFEYERAKLSGLSFSYHAGDERFCYAVGKDDWVPLPIAAMMVDRKLPETLDLVSRFCVHSLWLQARHPVYRSWVEANDTIFGHLSNVDHEASLDTVAHLSSAWPLRFAFMPPSALSYEYRKCWQRVYVDMSEDWLACAAVHAEFARLAVSLDVEVSLQLQLKTLTEYAAVWFEARGMTVDLDNSLLSVPGYQALFYAADQSY